MPSVGGASFALAERHVGDALRPAERGHHGGRSALQQETALYYFGDAEGPSEDTVIDQLQLAPTILGRLGAPVADTMKAQSFLK